MKKMKTQAKPRKKIVRECYCHCHGCAFTLKGDTCECATDNDECKHCIPSGIPEVKSKHKHTLQGKTLREQIDYIIGQYGLSFAPTEKQYGIFMEEAEEKIIQAFQEAIISCLPEKISYTDLSETRRYYEIGYNQAINEMRSNIQKLLDDKKI